MKKYRSLIKPIVALAAVGLWVYVHRYPTARIPTACEKFTAGVAIDFVRPEWCERVPIEAEAGAGSCSGSKFEMESWRSRCFLTTAIKTHDTKLCRKVKPIREGMLDGGLCMDGSGFNEAYCIDSVEKSFSWGQGLSMPDNELAPVMHQLGYTEQTLLDAGIDLNDTFGWQSYVNKLLFNTPGMPRYERSRQEKRDFLGKVDHLRCREPFAAVAWNVGVPVVLVFVTLFAALRIWSIVR